MKGAISKEERAILVWIPVDGVFRIQLEGRLVGNVGMDNAARYEAHRLRKESNVCP